MVLIVYLLIHVIFGFYFLYNPDFLLNIGSELFKLSGVWYKRFLSQVRDGAFMGLTSHYSVSAMYMSLGFIIFTANVLTKKKYESNSNRLNVILFFIFFVALILTQKRGHLLFCIITFILMYFVGFISNKKILL
ncbi:MAG: hypothetical protein LUG60_06590 [Erysipelotrichaceae bacterium]|nr:hypothetical protein [Erysipelotrichaceae bacterium]